MEQVKEIYKLAKLPVFALKELKRITFNDGKMTTENISRNGLFSRMYNYDDVEHATRLVIPHKTDYYISVMPSQEDKKKDDEGVYRLSEDGEEYVRVDAFNLLDNNNELREEIEQAAKKAMITLKLSGRSPVRCDDSSLANGKNLAFIVKSPVDGVEYECARHDRYIQTFYRIHIPIINKNGEVETKELPYGDTVYRYAQQGQDHWLGIPKGYMYIIVNVNKDDENYGSAELYKDDAELVGERARSLDELVAQHKDELKTNARKFAMSKLIDFSNPYTQFFCQLKN